METEAGDTLEYCKQSLMVVLIRGQIGMRTIKAKFMKFQMGIKIILKNGLNTMCVTF